jgi:surface antigen
MLHGRLPRALLCAALLMPVALAASEYAFLVEHTPLAHFDETDKAMLLDAARHVLESDDVAKPRKWSNPDTGNSGQLEVLNSFESTSGRFCKTVRIENRAGAMENKSYYPVCRDEDGTWKIDAGAKPANRRK